MTSHPRSQPGTAQLLSGIAELDKHDSADARKRLSRPFRVQRKRTRGWKMPPNTVSVCRPGRWGNPFRVGHEVATAAEAAQSYRNIVMAHDTPELRADLETLRGKNLACFCALATPHGEYSPCHADVLLSLANDIPMDEVINENLRRAKGETAQ
jgi:hypothetical protein